MVVRSMSNPDLSQPMSSHARAMMDRRERLLGPNNPTFYDEPVNFVRGEGVWLYDHAGQRYLDCYNNVAHVGHCHPKVVEAVCRQTSTLNTHSRYLHDNMLDYAERLTATFDPSLNTLLYTCTGSEANDVALRMARQVTGNQGIIVTDHAYHGNTELVMELGTIFSDAESLPSYVKTIPAPDSYHLPADAADLEQMGDQIIDHLQESIAALQKAGHGLAALLICPIFANEGFPDLPADLNSRLTEAVHAAGGMIIADEVQSGFGRCGAAMWGHQATGFLPDLVTLGKPMGNGYPIAGVVTRADIMSTFRQNSMYFNTFAANPVACAAALATLAVISDEDLINNAATVGEYSRNRLVKLQERFAALGNIRGSGLFFGGEFVSDRETKLADSVTARKVMNRMREEGVIMGVIGSRDNLLKIRPPMPFSKSNADLLFDKLQYVLDGI